MILYYRYLSLLCQTLELAQVYFSGIKVWKWIHIAAKYEADGKTVGCLSCAHYSCLARCGMIGAESHKQPVNYLTHCVLLFMSNACWWTQDPITSLPAFQEDGWTTSVHRCCLCFTKIMMGTHAHPNNLHSKIIMWMIRILCLSVCVAPVTIGFRNKTIV